MTAKDLVGYQFGNAKAIRRVAGSRYLLVGAGMLVLITSVPRNYDQIFIGEVPWWPVIPLLFSIVSGTFLFLVLQSAFLREVEARLWTKYSLFLGLFWMTAPIAWLYGIPFERFMDSRAATIANLWLLGIVSVWRVALITRVLSVVFSVPWMRASGWVLVAASVEVVVVLFFRVMGEAIGRSMGGMRNSPEQDLILHVLNAVFVTCVFAAPALLIVMVGTARLFPEKARLTELPKNGRFPALTLGIAWAAWILIAIPSQRELGKEYRYRSLLKEDSFKQALAYLNTLEPEDWPRAKSFRPDPYDGEVREWLPGLMAEVRGNEKQWIQKKLIWVFERTFDHRWSLYSGDELVTILKGTEKFEGGKDWIRGSRGLWGKPMIFESSPATTTNLISFLEGYGVTVSADKE
jgi:hypothetical protein